MDSKEEEIMVERAKWLARMVHADEFRMNGEPYYIHPERMAEALKDKSAKIRIAAHDHDIFENAKNPDTIRLLASEYFPRDVVHLIETLTNDKNIHYMHYIDVVCNNPDALIIKIQDLIDNTTDIDRLSVKQKTKYRDACIYMVANRGIDIPQILKERLQITDDDIRIKKSLRYDGNK